MKPSITTSSILKVNKRKHNINLFVALTVIPAIIYFTIFIFLPFFMNIMYMFCDYNYLKPPTFVGLKNIQKFFTDPIILQCFMNTFVITIVSVPIMITIAILISTALFYMKWGRSFFRSAIFSTYLTSLVVAAIVFKSLFGSELGFINGVLTQMGLEKIPWLSEPVTAMMIVIMLSIWKYFGYYVVVFLAGFSNVDPVLFEAAKIDGANGRQTFFFVTIPQLKPTIIYSAIIASITFLRTYSTVLVLTKGGPYSSTQTVLMYMFDQGFSSRNVGYASVIAVALFLIIFVITLFQMKFSKMLETE